MAQTIQTPVPARTNLTYSNVPREPNRRPYTTERPLSLKNNASRTAVPIRRNVHVHSKHTAQCKKSFQHLFLVREHRRPHQTRRNVHCALTGHSTGRERLKQRNAANQHALTKDALHTNSHDWCARHNVSHNTSRSFSTVPLPFNSHNRKRTVNVLEVHSSTQNQCVPQCTRANDSSVLHFQRCSSQMPSRQPVSCSFLSTARRSHQMVPTSNLQLASSLLGRATILGSETSCCSGPY